jgi:signal transduction histidine kinase
VQPVKFSSLSQQQIEISVNHTSLGSDQFSGLALEPRTLETQIQAVQSRLQAMLHLNATGELQPELQAQLQQTLALLVELQTAAGQYQSRMVQAWRDQQIMQLTQRLRQSLNPVEIAEQTAVAVQQLLQVERVGIYHLRATGEPTGKIGEATAIAEAVQPGLALPDYNATPLLHQTLKLAITTDQRGLSFNELGLDQTTDLPLDLAPALKQLINQLINQQRAQALLIAPVQQDNTILGLIAAHQLSGPRQWQADEIKLLQQLSTEVAIALRQSELYQQAQQANADLEQQVQQRTRQLSNALDYESTLKRITDRVRDSLDERHILEAALQELTVVLKLAGCNAAIYDLNQGTSTVQYEFTQSLPTLQGRVAQMEDFPEIYQQLKQGRWFQFCSLLPNPVRGRVAMLACPIFVDPQSSRGVDQSVLGDLWLIHHPDHMFDEYEIRLVQQVANQCAIAIRQARLYQAAQGQVQELAELNRLKDEFLSTVSHELRTPITNIKMAIQMLRTSTTDDRRAKYIRILEQEAVREADLINDLLDLQQLQVAPRQVELEPIVLHDWLPKLVEPFQPRFMARQQQFRLGELTDLPPFASEIASLRRILAELLNNACKYTAPGGQIELWVESEAAPSAADAESLSFVIANQATIPAQELPKIFDKFYRCPKADPWKQGGTGLGLALVKKLVERLQGEIHVSSLNGWTEFRVKLPALDPFLALPYSPTELVG